MSLEQLMAVELETITASKYSQKLSDTASPVTVIEKDQIQQFGFRTLSDVLRTVPGFFITNNRLYDNAGIRGFDQSADFNGRMLVMIDGTRMNEAIYDSGFTDNNLPIDMDLVERVEIVRGPGSSLYGNNAFFAVVNVITKKGKDFQGGELAGAWSSFNSFKGRASYGRGLDNGVDFLMSASGFNSDGQALRIAEAATPSNPLGASSNANDEHDKQFFAKAQWGSFSFEGGYGRRNKGVPGGIIGVDFGSPSSNIQDSEAFASLQYQKALSPKLDFTARAFFGDYDMKGVFRYGGTRISSLSHAWWSGLEARLLSTHIDNHKILGGVEIQENWRQQQYADAGPLVLLDAEQDTHRIGIFLQDDISLAKRLNLSVGARFDDNSLSSRSMFSPRLGLVWQALDDTRIKLQYGQAFRAPTISDQYYSFAGTPIQMRNHGLRAEQIETWTLAWEQAFAQAWHFTATGYYLKQNHRHGLVEESPMLAHTINFGSEIGYGGEFELQRRWNNGAMLRGGYSLIFAEDLGHDINPERNRVSNSPRHLLQLNFMAPLFSPQWRGGFDMQVLSPRQSPQGKTPAYARVGLNLLYQPIKQLDLSASAYDLFDNYRLEPGGANGIPQEGRTFRLKFELRF
jgi:iron complex outermembrane receptor protein